MIYDLPTSLTVCGQDYEINSDFRAVLDVIEVLNDTELTDAERAFFALGFFYPAFEMMPNEHHQEAIRWCFWFINGGKFEEPTAKKAPRLMDWEHDFPYIVSPVNRVIGHEIRADKYLHWWTFLGAYMEIGDCTFAQIVRIRSQIAKGKKLDKQDQEWYLQNRDLVDLETKYTAAEEDLLRMWGGG